MKNGKSRIENEESCQMSSSKYKMENVKCKIEDAEVSVQKIKMKKGFGVISALIIMLLVATLMVVVVKVSFISVKHTSDTYLQQRAQLFMQSAVENTLTAIEGYDRKKNNSCLEHIIFRDEQKRFTANVDILKYYCYDTDDCPCNNAVKISTPFSHGFVLLKVTVESNITNPKNGNKKIRLEKVTLQRP